MPVILEREDEQAWIDSSLNQEKTLALLKPFDENKMVAEEIDKGLFEQKEKGGTFQPTLF